MLGLTPLGAIHTAISLVALASGVLALVRHLEISPAAWLGRVYVWTTVLTCLTGFGIFQHGGFGKPHALGIVTLIVLGLAGLGLSRQRFIPPPSGGCGASVAGDLSRRDRALARHHPHRRWATGSRP